MKVQAPTSVYAVGGKYDMNDNSDTPDTLDVHYQYPGFTHIFTVRRSHYNYGFPDRPQHIWDKRAQASPREPQVLMASPHGIEFHGTKEILTLDRSGWIVRAEGRAGEMRCTAILNNISRMCGTSYTASVTAMKTQPQPSQTCTAPPQRFI